MVTREDIQAMGDDIVSNGVKISTKSNQKGGLRK